MKIPYIKIPITDMSAYLAPYGTQTKGKIFQAVLDFGMYQTWPTLDLSPAEAQGYQAVQEIVEHEIKAYKKFCKEQKQKAQKLWKKMPSNDEAAALPPGQCQTNLKQEAKQELEAENNILPAAQPGAQAASGFWQNLPSPATLLERFAQQTAQRFEPSISSATQYQIWFKRNARCLRDILNFCCQDIPLALQTISICAIRLQKAGLTGGYEAVCRNLPEYYAQAQQERAHLKHD